MLSRANPGARRVAPLSPQTIQTRGQRFAHARVELHLRSFVLPNLCFRQRRGLCRQIEVVPVCGQFRAMVRIRHSPLELRGSAPDSPPDGFRFEKVANGMIGVFLLEAHGIFDGASNVARIDLIEGRPHRRRNHELLRLRRSRATHHQKNEDQDTKNAEPQFQVGHHVAQA